MKENIGLEEYTGNQIVAQPRQTAPKPVINKNKVLEQAALANELEAPKEALVKPLLAPDTAGTAAGNDTEAPALNDGQVEP